MKEEVLIAVIAGVVVWLALSISAVVIALLIRNMLRERRRERSLRREPKAECLECPVWMVCHLDAEYPCVKGKKATPPTEDPEQAQVYE